MTQRTTLLAIVMTALMSLGLFLVSYQVQDMEEQLESLNQSMARDREAIHVLKAEWSHLNDPIRLQKLAEKYLGLGALETEQLGQIEDLPWRAADVDADADVEPLEGGQP